MKKTVSIILLTLLFVNLFACNNVQSNTEIQKPTVKFITNCDTEIASIQTDVLMEEPKCEKENYAFDGWYYDERFNCPVAYPAEIKYDTTLYARWIKAKSAITHDGEIIYNKYNTQRIFDIDLNPFNTTYFEEKDYKLKIDISLKSAFEGNTNIDSNLYIKIKSGDNTLKTTSIKVESTTLEETNLNYTIDLHNIREKNIKIFIESNQSSNQIKITNLKFTTEFVK